MDNKRTPEQRIALGDWAKRLDEDPNFTALCNGMVAESLVELMGTKPGSEEATKAHISLLSAERFKQSLKMLINDATMAREALK